MAKVYTSKKISDREWLISTDDSTHADDEFVIQAEDGSFVKVPVNPNVDQIPGLFAPSTLAPAWAPTTNYKQGQVISYQGSNYAALVDFTSGASFNPSNWLQVGVKSGIYVGMAVTSVKTAAYTAKFGEVVQTNPSLAAAVVPITLPTLGQGQGSVTVKRVDAASQGRTDAGCGTTSGSPVVTDTNITAADVGRSVTYTTGIPTGLYVGTVILGTSFRLSYSPTAQFDAYATATGTVSVTLGDLPNLYGTNVIGPMDDGTTNDALNEFLESVVYVPNDIANPTAWVRI